MWICYFLTKFIKFWEHKWSHLYSTDHKQNVFGNEEEVVDDTEDNDEEAIDIIEKLKQHDTSSWQLNIIVSQLRIV